MNLVMSVNAHITIQPSFRQVPAIWFFSIKVTSLPNFPSSKDPNLPAGPDPITIFFIYTTS